jgi:hypothetical protein
MGRGVMTPKHSIVSQALSIGGSGVGCAVAWLVRPSTDRRLFLATLLGALTFSGLAAVASGELVWGGRHGPPKVLFGTPARVGGAVMVVGGLLAYVAFICVR